jgi:hypothetical protein
MFIAIVHDEANHSNKLAASEALVYKCRSMAALRKQLTRNASSPETFQTILGLSWTEILVEDKVAALFHLKMMSHIVDLAGGLARLDSWSMEPGVFADVYFSCTFLSQPQFDRTEWAPAPVAAEWKRRLQPATGDIPTKLTVTPDLQSGRYVVI